VIQPGWLDGLLSTLAADPALAAAQGIYHADRRDCVWARVMGLDLEQRYARIPGDRVDHVCTGNTAYRTRALWAVGLFDESFGYGYDNDMSYRLGAAGYDLALCRDARSTHYGRAGLRGYFGQQYGMGYGRLDLVARHPRRIGGDRVSGLGMMLHATGTAAALALLICAAALPLFGLAGVGAAKLGGGILAALFAERLVAGALAARRFREPVGLLFAPVHLVRDLAWAIAIGRWTLRRLWRIPMRPGFSMSRTRS